MPIYVYRFEDGTEVEVLHSMLDDPHERLPHPETGRPRKVKRVPQSAIATFKGDGWARKP